ncbi:helix-turn-helix transcriptional regulator [Methanobrevibacter sp.]|uniref:helix-turn-helix transcriptional regulator n=1 Tax=Methanobrevibacter sp. TaxID=66852 RepID=UPI003865537B
MTNLQTKRQLNEEFKNVKYILTSSMRAKLLLALYEIPKNLDELRNELKKPSATILHGLKELESINLVRRAQKYYELTSNGYLLTTNMIKLIENWYSLGRSEVFWDNHDLYDIPDEIIRKIYLLKDAEYINSTTSDLSIAFNKYIELISNAKNLHIILPIYSENHFKHIIDLLNNGKIEYLKLIISDEIYNSINENELFKKELLENEKVIFKVINFNLKIFLTYSEEFMSLTLFFKDGHYDDSQILIGKDENAIKWAKSLLKYYEGY